MSLFGEAKLLTINLKAELQGDLMEESFDQTKLIFDLNKKS